MICLDDLRGARRGGGTLSPFARRLFSAFLAALALPAFAVQKTVVWTLPADWEEGVAYGTTDGYLDISGGALQRRYGLGRVGEPDLPTLTFRVAIPKGGSFVGVSAEADWEPVDTAGRLPIPIAEPVPYGAQLAYPAPDAAAYGGPYPKSAAVAGETGHNAGVTMVPVRVTPFKWDGAAKSLSKASAMKVTVTLDAPRLLSLSAAASAAAASPRSARSRAAAMTVNPSDAVGSSGLRLTAQAATSPSGQIIIVSPSEFVGLWRSYAAFRKSTDAGKDFEYIVKDTAEIYTNATLNTVEGDDALAIHHWLETVYHEDREQYVILGAAPKKYAYDRATMIPARYVVNQGGLDQVCDMYYGCMDRMKGGKIDSSAEVWDYDLDGTYMGHKNSGGGYTSDSNDNVDWMMDMSVTRVPLMREVAETKDGRVWRMTAAEIMDHFTNKIAFVESEARFDPPKRWRHVLGGGYLFNSYARGAEDYLVEGERAFFDGGCNMFDEGHKSPAPDAEACPRDRNFITYSKARAARHGLINTGGLVTTDWADLYKAWGEIFDVHCHGWARGADPGTTGGALFATGLFRIYNMALPCESGMYDYCPSGSYGITNCVSMGEAPLLCFEKLGGGVVTFNNTRYGWWGGYNGMSGRMEGLINDAFYGQVGGVGPMNAGEVCVYMHNNCEMYNCGNRGGASNLEVVMHGDPLIRISPQEARTWDGTGTVWTTNAAEGAVWTIAGKSGAQPMDYTTDLTVDATGRGGTAFDVRDDLAAARFRLTGDAGATVILEGAGTFRVTDRFTVAGADLEWCVAGGAGRNGIAFEGTRGNVTLPGNAQRYFGSAFTNVNELKVTGGNVTLDTPKGATAAKNFDIRKLSFVAPTLDEAENYNVLRTRTEGLLPADMTVAVVSNRLALQTCNVGGGTADNRDRPLFFVTNGYLKVRYNPHWGTEYFVRPTHLTDGHIVGDYEKFGFGCSKSNGYDLYVGGKSSIDGEKPILLNGELRVRVAAGAELEIANPMTDGPELPGRLRVMGSGKVRITGPQSFTGGIVVEDGCTLELGIAKAVQCDISVEHGGELRLDAIPLAGVKAVTLADGSRLVLAGQTGAGLYQIVDSATSSISLGATARVYDLADVGTPLDGKLANGYFLQSANLIYWNGASGTWRDEAGLSANWRDAAGRAVAFTNTMPVVFPSVVGEAEVRVTVDGVVRPGYAAFDNTNSCYAFTGTAGSQVALESLAVGYDALFGVGLAVANIFRVMGGDVSAGDVEASLVEVSGGSLHATGALTVTEKKVKAIRFSFASAKDAGNITAVQELRLFNEDGWFALPDGTVIEDIAGQKIRITGHDDSDMTHTWAWESAKPSNENESLKALVDGTPSYNNKWWASKKSAPTWFTITFPTPQKVVTGYNLKAADHAPRNPKAWSVSTSADGTSFSLAASVEGVTFASTGAWMQNDGKSAGWPLQSVDGELRVKKGGTVFADGRLSMNLAFEAGATLAVTNRCALSSAAALATLTLPDEEGAVRVDATRAAVTDEAFPILVGYGLTAEDFLKFSCASDTAVLNLIDGDLYVVTDGIVQAPYTADVLDNEIVGGKLKWSELHWRDRNGAEFTWDDGVNYQSGSNATINIGWLQAGATTLEIDVGGALGLLTVTGKAADALTFVWQKAFVPRTLDFSGYAGKVALDYGEDGEFALGYSDFTAGATLEIPSAGMGSLTVAAGNRAVVPGWGDWSKVTGAGTIAVATAADLAATWANANGVSGTNQVVRGKWEIKNTSDYPRNKEVLLTGADALLKLGSCVDTTGYGNYTTGLTVEDGATVQVAKRDTFNRALTLRNGGAVRLTADATDSNRALDLYERASIFVEGTGNVFGGTAATADSETGDPIVNSGIIALRDSSGLTVTTAAGASLDVYSQWGGGACLWYAWTKTGAGMMSFYRASGQTGNMNVKQGVVRLVNKGQGTTGAIVNQSAVWLDAKEGFVQTVANVISGVGSLVKLGPGTSVLTGDNAYSGATTVREGTLRIGGAKALGSTASVVLEGGVLDLGGYRFADKTVSVSPGAKIRVELTDEEAASQVQLVKLVMASGTAKDYFTFVVDGAELPPSGYELQVSESGAIEFRPLGFSGYAFPLETTAADARDWTAFKWYDQQGVAFKSNWSDCVSIGAVVKVEEDGAAVMTLDEEDVTLSQLTIRNHGTLAISNGTKRLTASSIDLSDSRFGTALLDFDIGEALLTAGGSVTLTRPGTGAMKITENASVTLVDATERGTVSLGDGATLRYAGTQTQTTLPWMTTDNRTGGAIAYAMPVVLASGEAVFGGEGESAAATCGDFVFEDGFSLSVARLVTGNGAGSRQSFLQTGGALSVTDEPLLIGKDGAVGWTMSGGTLGAKGIADGGASGSSFTLAGGVLELGTNGLTFTNNTDLVFAGGTLRSVTDATISAANGIAVTGDTRFEAAAGTTLTIASPVTGSGTIYCGGEGTVKFLGDCKNASLAGTLTIQLQAYQESNKDTSSYLFNIPSGADELAVTILGTDGEVVSADKGKGVKGSDNKYHWKPSGTTYVQPITATLTGGTVALGTVSWYDATGVKASFSHLSGDIELQLVLTENTTINNADDRRFAKMRITSPTGKKLTINNDGWIYQLFGYQLIFEEADIQTDVAMNGQGLYINKLTGLASGKTLTLNRYDHLTSFGDGPFYGTVNCRNFEPPWTGVFGDPGRWQGTLKLASSGKTLAGEDRFWDEYGNDNSKLELSGKYTGYLKPGGSTALDLKLNGTLTFTDGYSKDGGYTFAGALSGAGNIVTTKSPSDLDVKDVIRFTGDASEFAGTVDVRGGHCVAFGEQDDDDSGCNKIIIGQAAVIASDKKWTAEDGISVKAGGRLTIMPRSGGDLASSSEIEIAEGGTLDLRANGSPNKISVTSGMLSVSGTLCVNGEVVTDYTIEGGTVRFGGEDPDPIVLGAKWGNVGTAEKGGVATGYNRGRYGAFTVDFGATKNICTTEIGADGLVKITQVRIAGRDSDDANIPGRLTIAQDGVSIASARRDHAKGALPVYRPAGTVIATYPVNVFTFTNDVWLATDKTLTFSFDTGTQTGFGVIQPANDTMVFSGNWSPIVEITGDYSTIRPHSISINVIGGNSDRPGRKIASDAAGLHPVAADGWNQLAQHTAGGTFSEKAERLVETLADGTVEAGPASATLSGSCTYTAGIEPSNADAELAFGYIDDGGSGARIVVEGIPYSKYDVYVYMGTDTSGKSADSFGSVAVSCTGFSTNYPSAGQAWGSADATHGEVVLAEGQNCFKVSDLSGSTLTVAGSNGGTPSGTRCGLAGIQIVNAGVRQERLDYSANITRTSVTWDYGCGTGLANHGEWQNTGLNAITLTNDVVDAALNFNSPANASRLAVVQDAGQTLKLTASAETSFGGYDTSCNAGTLILGYSFGAALDVANGPFVMPQSATLGFDLGAGTSLEVSGTTTASDRLFGLLVTSGTLTLGTTRGEASPLRGRVVTARGANAAIKVTQTDGTGYKYGAKRIVLEDGGQFQIGKRDTLISPIELCGGAVALKSSCVDGNRGLDLYAESGNSWTVKAAADATEDAPTVSKLSTDPGMGTDGRKVFVRKGDWNIDVAANARMEIEATLISECSGEKGTGKVVKAGAGELVLKAANAYALETVVEDGVLTVTSDQSLGTGGVTLKAAGMINLEADVVTNAYALCRGKIALSEGAGIWNVTVNSEALDGVWKFNDATNGIVRVIEEKDYPDGEDTSPVARMVIDDAVENGLVNSKGETLAQPGDVAAAVKAASAGTSTPEQRRITNSMMLGSEELVGDDAALDTAISMAADGTVTVTVSGEKCTLQEGPVLLGHLILWTADGLGDGWTPSAITEVTTENAATVVPPQSALSSRFFKSSFEWKKPSGL